FGNGLVNAAAGAQGQAEATVARQVAGAGQHQVTGAGQSHQGVFLGPQRSPQATHFGQAAGTQGRAGVVAQLQSVGHAAGHGNDILDGTAQLGTDQVGGVIGPEAGAVQKTGPQLTELRRGGTSGHGRGQTAGHLVGKG